MSRPKLVRLLSGSFAEEGETKLAENGNSLDKPAMLVYNGEFDSMDGKVVIDDSDIDKLAENHNGMLAKLSRLTTGEHHPKHNPPIQLDHSTSARDTIGRLVGNLTVGEHKLSDGTVVKALFGNARILGKDNVERVQDGRWTHLSGGFDLENHRVTELTVTPFPAAAEASLLSKRLALKVEEGDKVEVTTGKHEGKKGTVVAAGKNVDENMEYAIVKIGGFEQKLHVGDLKRLSKDQFEMLVDDDYDKHAYQVYRTASGQIIWETVRRSGIVTSKEEGVKKAKEAIDEYLQNNKPRLSNPLIKKHLSEEEMPKYKELKDKMGMYEKCKKHLMDAEKLSEEQVEERLAALADEDVSKMSAEHDEKEKELATKKDKETEAELKRLAANKDKKDKLVALSKGMKATSGNVQLAARKTSIRVRLSRLASEQKITPAEIKALNLDEMASKSSDAIEAALSSYDKREPVIDVGLYGSTKALTAGQLSKKLKSLTPELAELKSRLQMPMKRADGLKRLAELGLTEGDLDKNLQVQVDTAQQGQEHDVDFDAAYSEMKRLVSEGKEEEAKAHFKRHMASPAQAPQQIAGDPTAEMSALADEVKKMQTGFDDFVKLTASDLGVTPEELA